MNNQTQMAFALGGEAETRDPVSGNDVPPGSLPVEVRDDIPARLSEGEYVVPADVVRFFGVKFFEDIRMQAKKGLQQMDRDGRIGGEPVDDQMISDQDLAQLEGMLSQQGMAAGGLTQGGMMDKLLNAVRTNPVVNERMKAAGIPIEMAVGGSVGIGIPSNSQNVDPRKVDEVIAKIGAAAQQNPELMRMLGERGINVPRTTATQTPEQMQQANSPAATTNPIMNEKPVAANAGGLMGYQEGGTTGTFDPTKYTTVGGTLFDPNTYTPGSSVPIPEAAPAAVENEQTCAARGLVYDPATKQCAMPTPVNDNDDNDDYGTETESTGEFTKPEVDYFSLTDEELAEVGSKKPGIVEGIASIFSPIRAALQGQNIAQIRAAASVAEIRGNDEIAKTLTEKANALLATSSNIVQLLDSSGQLNGNRFLANQIKFNAPNGMEFATRALDGGDYKSKSGKTLTKAEFDRLMRATATAGMKYDSKTGTYERDEDPFKNLEGVKTVDNDAGGSGDDGPPPTHTVREITDTKAFEKSGGIKPKLRPSNLGGGSSKPAKTKKAKDPVANSGRFKAEGGLITKRKKK